MASAYPVIKRDMLITAALLHDVGKTRELSSFPLNDYTDEGQLLGHIIIGAQMIHDLIKEIPDFPLDLENQLVHCILAHHGELEYGSPKKPAMVEAVALNLADNTDARMETLTEIFAADKSKLVYDVLGALRLEIADQLGLLKKDEYRFVWITEFPLLEWSEELGRYQAMHHPFTMPMEEDLILSLIHI